MKGLAQGPSSGNSVVVMGPKTSLIFLFAKLPLHKYTYVECHSGKLHWDTDLDTTVVFWAQRMSIIRDNVDMSLCGWCSMMDWHPLIPGKSDWDPDMDENQIK